VKILGISGSLRRSSYNSALLQAAAELAEDGVEVELWDGLKDVPPYDEDDDVEDAPAAVERLRRAIVDADAILFATPEYNSSVPGQLKNAIDWASRPLATNPLRNKPVAVIGASKGAFGAVWAQAELRKVLSATGARTLESGVAAGQVHTKLDERGRLTDAELRARIGEVVRELASAVRERAERAREASPAAA
jgi:chromate reductase